MSPIPADYVDVAERIREFRAQYPDGSLQAIAEPRVMTVGGKDFIVYAAAAYRTPDDERPGVGYAWEPVPGPTPFTRDSELMNAETSAWGRAIVALGFSTKKIASADEVRNRQAADETPREAPQAAVTPPADPPTAEQWAAMAEVLEALETVAKPEAGQRSWNEEALAYTKDAFDKTPAELSGPEVDKVIEEFKERLTVTKIPFGSEAAA